MSVTTKRILVCPFTSYKKYLSVLLLQVCAPRWTYPFQDKRDLHYLGNGACYIEGKTVSKTLTPLTDRSTYLFNCITHKHKLLMNYYTSCRTGTTNITICVEVPFVYPRLISVEFEIVIYI